MWPIYFRSIGAKIYGMAIVLLLFMAAAVGWSLYSKTQLNQQFVTLTHTLIPLSTLFPNLRDELVRLDDLLDHALFADKASEETLAEFTKRVTTIERLHAEATTLIDRGAEIATLDRNRMELARLAPIVALIAHHHRRLQGNAERLLAALRATERPVPATIRLLTSVEIEEVDRLINLVAQEVQSYVEEMAEIAEHNEHRSVPVNFLLFSAAALVGLVFAFVVSRSLSLPLRRLRLGTQAVEAGRLDGEVPVTSRDEIGDVTRAFNFMVAELRAKERIRETFGQYVDPRVVGNLLDGRLTEATFGEKRIVTVFFSDIAGFTSLGERLTPKGLVTLINEYFSVMSRSIRVRNGIIDKYIGDSLMAFWSPPFVAQADQAASACAAALEQLERLVEFRASVPDLIGLRLGMPEIDMRISLASGEVIVGSIGSEIARSFTVMGDTVNLGSRLNGVNKVYGTRIIIDGATRNMAGDAIETRELDAIVVAGKTEPVHIHELLALKGGLDPVMGELRDGFAVALAAYRAGDWAAASAGFNACLTLRPDDKPSAMMRARTADLSAAPPAEWDGVWRLTRK